MATKEATDWVVVFKNPHQEDAMVDKEKAREVAKAMEPPYGSAEVNGVIYAGSDFKAVGTLENWLKAQKNTDYGTPPTEHPGGGMPQTAADMERAAYQFMLRDFIQWSYMLCRPGGQFDFYASMGRLLDHTEMKGHRKSKGGQPEGLGFGAIPEAERLKAGRQLAKQMQMRIRKIKPQHRKLIWGYESNKDTPPDMVFMKEPVDQYPIPQPKKDATAPKDDKTFNELVDSVEALPDDKETAKKDQGTDQTKHRPDDSSKPSGGKPSRLSEIRGQNEPTGGSEK